MAKTIKPPQPRSARAAKLATRRHPVIRLATLLRRLPLSTWRWFIAYWQRNWFHKAIVGLAVLVVLCVGGMYGIARWYIWSQRDKPLELGATYIADYAQSLGVDPKATLTAMLDDLHIKHLRLVSYWDKIEPSDGKYDFSQLDWEFAQANAHGAKVSLAIGLRQPRWPECHMPAWAASEPKSVWFIQLDDFMKQVIERYQNNPALESYQLENEYFLQVFGQCPDFSRDRLVDEFNFVKDLDHSHPVIVSRSNNALGTPIYAPTPDEYGVSIYKRVWIPFVGRYGEYPFPAWFYAFLAGTEKIVKGKDTVIHELQAEPWPPKGLSIQQASLDEQSKSLDAKRLHQRFTYAEATGMKSIDLWGAEYWYYRKVVLHDPTVWDAAQEEYDRPIAKQFN